MKGRSIKISLAKVVHVRVILFTLCHNYNNCELYSGVQQV